MKLNTINNIPPKAGNQAGVHVTEMKLRGLACHAQMFGQNVQVEIRELHQIKG